MELPYVNLPWLGASLTPVEKHTPEMKDLLILSNEMVDELLAADHIVISTRVLGTPISEGARPSLVLEAASVGRMGFIVSDLQRSMDFYGE